VETKSKKCIPVLNTILGTSRKVMALNILPVPSKPLDCVDEHPVLHHVSSASSGSFIWNMPLCRTIHCDPDRDPEIVAIVLRILRD
jgi:hypothetical protein